MFTLAAFGIILDKKDKILLSHRTDYNLWNLPGGRVEDNENPWEAVVREINEETGLKARVIHLSGVYSKAENQEIVFSFVCEVIGGTPQSSDEADIHKYFSLKDIPQNTSPKQVARIHDYFANKNHTYYKTQHGPGSIELIKQGKL